MFDIFRKKKRQNAIILATLNARLQPIDRGEIEDAFDAVSAQRGLGACVVGGGTLMQESGEVISCDVEIEVEDASEKTVDVIIQILEAMLAPRGSQLHLPGQQGVIHFGRQEGLALYLNGTDLPGEVYQSCDSNYVYAECNRLLEGIGRVSSHWAGPRETALYMYGTEFDTMRDRLTPLLETYPLCKQSRIEKIA